MRFLKQIFIIFLATFLGEALHAFLPFPVPAGVYGLFLLFGALCSGAVKLGDVEDFGGFLLEIMPLTFIPPAVKLLDLFGDIRPIILELSVIMAVTTILVMAATGLVAQYILRRNR